MCGFVRYNAIGLMVFHVAQECPPPARDAGAFPRRGASLARRLWQATVVACWIAIGLLVAGFAWFAFIVAKDEVPLQGAADGIVALTGGASRLADAVELLASGRGRRLLISGLPRPPTPPT